MASPEETELRNIICAQASNPDDTNTKLAAFRASIRRELAEEIARELSGCCTECDACIETAKRLTTQPTG
ncbi:hypothetical protein [Streptomyces misionensis]|uniref:hypothetical protein n=1 Tax=Streptomyces misionensis TaxID=67331 RepID=UPI0036915A25